MATKGLLDHKARHDAAMRAPYPGFETALRDMVRGLCNYPAAHQGEYGSKLSEDGVIGEAWADAAKGFLGLLTGERGRLDGGTLDSMIRDAAEAAGFTRDLEVAP